MRKNMKGKLMPFFITMVLLASTLVFSPFVGNVAAVSPNAHLYPNVDNNGAGDIPLTCGDELTIKVTNGLLWPESNYFVAVWNGSGWNRLCSSKIADKYGDIILTFAVPGWNDLGYNPVTANGTGGSAGQWNVNIINASTPTVGVATNITLTITNLYDVYYTYESSDKQVSFIKNKEYASIDVYVRNWTGFNSGWDDAEEEESFTIQLFNATYGKLYPTGSAATMTNGKWAGIYFEPSFTYYNQSDESKETYVYFNVSDGTHTTSARFPILFDMTASVPTSAVWGDEISFTGYVKDGQGNGIGGYKVRLYAHNSAGAPSYITEVETQGNGKYSISVDTGTDETAGCAGTWYVGTYATGGYPRVNTTYLLPVVGFIPYATFNVATKNDAVVEVVTSDDIVTGFNQTINISVYNSSWMNSDTNWTMYRNMNVHITGVDNYNWATHEEYDEDDIVPMNAQYTGTKGKYAYYEFTWVFNDTGTVTIWVSHQYDLSMIAFSDTVTDWYDSYYDDKTGLLPNVTGTATFSIVGAGDINIDTESSMPDAVAISDVAGDCGYKNNSTTITINVYGDTAGSYKNASINITGCGVDVSIKEDDPDANDGTYGYTSQGEYWAIISPKTAGTITITAHNSSDDVSVSKDYSISGLSGSVTTELGGNKLITCGSTEKITATITNGQYAEVTVTYFDINWANCKLLNETTGDNTAGEGLNGIFEFVPDIDDMDNVGFIVVGASAGSGQYMYDIVEVEPIHDLVVEVTTPATGNQTLTVGLDQDVIVTIKSTSGSYVTADSPEVVGYLLYEDYDMDTTDYQIEFSNYGTGTYKASLCGGGDGWLPYAGTLLIEAKNATGAQEHNGSISLDVDYATVTYSPGGATAGILERNLTVEVTVIDANGNPLANEYIWFYVENNTDDDCAKGTEGFEYTSSDPEFVRIRLDEDGKGEFDIGEVGDAKTWINGSLQARDEAPIIEYDECDQNNTDGTFMINFPVFTVDPDTIYIGQANTITITAKDYAGAKIEGINLTFVSSVVGILASQPDPVQTNADGVVVLSVSPEAGGKLNVTIARNVEWIGGQLNWSDAVVTDTYVTATSIKVMKISVSKSPVYQGDSFIATVTSNDVAVAGADVEFSGTTVKTDATGKATFTAPDPGVESVVYTVTAEKAGYLSAEKSITVIKIYVITAITPSSPPKAGETFTITIIAKGMPLAGATVTFNGVTSTSGGDGKLTLTAPSTKGDYTLTASYGTYKDYTTTITIGEGGGVPGFELFTLIAAIGIAFILLRRRW